MLWGLPVHTDEAVSLGFHIQDTDATHLAAARSAGAQFGVVVFSWQDIEPVPGYYDWQHADAALRAADFYGLDLIVRLDRPPAWTLDDTTSSPWNPDTYGEFARRVAERYGDRLRAVILWNEPNLAG